jgi:hypothetical protein
MGNAAAVGAGMEKAPQTLEEGVDGIVKIVSNFYRNLMYNADLRSTHRLIQPALINQALSSRLMECLSNGECFCLTTSFSVSGILWLCIKIFQIVVMRCCSLALLSVVFKLITVISAQEKG